MSITRLEAERASSTLPTGLFGIDDALVLIEIVYYIFEIWKSCPNKTTASSRRQDRFARISCRKACENFGYDVGSYDMSQMSEPLMTHCAALSNDVVAACCAEPVSEDIANVSRICDTACAP